MSPLRPSRDAQPAEKPMTDTPTSEPIFPTAKVRTDASASRWLSGSSRWLWLVTLGCLGMACGLTLWNSAGRGRLITVRFREGHGLKAEDTLRYRGIDVGAVEAVRLREELDGVDVVIRLHPDADAIAREGSRFWVERPQLSLARVSGLETVVGAKYVGVIPAGNDRPIDDQFEGLEHPPALRQLSDVTILIQFKDGFGLLPGDVVKYRGVVVGEVSDVRMQQDLSKVTIEARLSNNARSLARQGTLFWVERPNVSLKGIRGLDTLVGGHYLAALPDPEATREQFEFVGCPEPPPVLDQIDGGLHLTLTSEERYALDRGSLILFRGMTAGQVSQVELAANGHSVTVRAVIFPEYARLVRDNTRFWSRSGVDVHLGFGGLDLDVDPLASLTAGGIAFATPQPAGRLVESGHLFTLEEEAATDWKAWKPDLQLGQRDANATEEASPEQRSWLQRLQDRFRSSPQENEPEESP